MVLLNKLKVITTCFEEYSKSRHLPEIKFRFKIGVADLVNICSGMYTVCRNFCNIWCTETPG